MQYVRFEDHQRLDTIDQKAIQELVDEYVREAQGSFLGGGFSGAASPVVRTGWDAGGPHIMKLGRFAAVTSVSKATLSGEEVITDSRVVVFDPADVGHSNYPISFAAQRALAEAEDWNYYPFIWAKAFEYVTDVDNRRFWDTGAGEEINIPDFATRSVLRVEFTVEPTTPAGTGWFKVARVTNWLGGAVTGPTISTEWFFDSDTLYDHLSLSHEDRVRYSDTTGVEWENLSAIKQVPRSLGILHHLLLLRRQCHRMMAFGTEDPVGVAQVDWDERPRYSLNAIYKILSDMTLLVDSHESQLNDQFVAASAIVKYVPDPETANEGAVSITHGRGLSVTQVAVASLTFLFEVTRPQGLSVTQWRDAYVTGISISDVLVPPGAQQGHADAKFPLRFFPIIPEASTQVSDFMTDGVMRFQMVPMQDQNQDGVFKPIEDTQDGFVWAEFREFRFSITLHCSLNSNS